VAGCVAVFLSICEEEPLVTNIQQLPAHTDEVVTAGSTTSEYGFSVYTVFENMAFQICFIRLISDIDKWISLRIEPG